MSSKVESLDVKLLLYAIQKTTSFEKTLAQRFMQSSFMEEVRRERGGGGGGGGGGRGEEGGEAGREGEREREGGRGLLISRVAIDKCSWTTGSPVQYRGLLHDNQSILLMSPHCLGPNGSMYQ